MLDLQFHILEPLAHTHYHPACYRIGFIYSY